MFDYITITIIYLRLQRVYRGYCGRKYAHTFRMEHTLFLSKTPQACVIQRICRGHLARIKNIKVAKAIVAMYIQRKEESRISMFIRFQAFGRRFITQNKVRVLLEIANRRNINEIQAIIPLQCMVRRRLAMLRVMRKRYDYHQTYKLQKHAVDIISQWYFKEKKRKKDLLDGDDLLSLVRKLKQKIALMLRVVRGFLGREKVARMKIQLAIRQYATISIQRIFRYEFY